MAILTPLVLLVFWIGFYPNPLLSILHASVDHLLVQVGAAAPLQLSEVLTRP
jgi:NADH-quinone oxidoreductase subunit M